MQSGYDKITYKQLLQVTKTLIPIELTFNSCSYPASLVFSVRPPFIVAADMDRNTTKQMIVIASSFIFFFLGMVAAL